ncbi:hypothetical protein [[Phormidium] sp. ETS-05]|uniref:hypothetical protein n=1 Tax=[Phormidium] sp. ETS-05 TaxID=222819 RepID=UPI0018EEFC57|nr:hypothetical protein [[Phormidium] sp. ETS-05]
MNAQLVDSIVKVVQALPQAEKILLRERLNLVFRETPTQEEFSGSPLDAEVVDAEALELWRSLGDDATTGCLENPSVNHDRYLYAKDQ